MNVVASCPPAYDWAKNSEDMDPCAVASSLISVCVTTHPFTSIRLNTLYPPPTKETQNSCTCSGPVYALVSACADCQGGIFDTWQGWSKQCDSDDIHDKFPRVPSVPIPSWASSFDVEKDISFNPASAKALVQSPSQSTSQSKSARTSTQDVSTLTSSSTLPPSSALPSSLASSSTESASSTSSFSVPGTDIPSGTDTLSTALQSTTGIPGANQTADQASSGNLKKSSNKGVIAGAVVVCLIFLVTLATILLRWFKRRRQPRTAPSAAYIAAYGADRPPSTHSFLQPGLFAERAGSPLVSRAYSDSQAGKYLDEEKSTSMYSEGVAQ